jgi:hypothetical protein
MSAKHFSDAELDDDEQLSGYEATADWLERRARRLMKRKVTRAELSELAQLRARTAVLRRDVEKNF